MGELNLESIKAGKSGADYKTYPLKTHDFNQNASTFTQIAEDTKKTDYVDNIRATLNNGGEKPTITSATDIIGKSLNLKDTKFLKNSDMESIFKAINNDDFDMNGNLYQFSDIRLKMFSTEKDGYGILDECGNIYRFDEKGTFLPNKDNKFPSVRYAINEATVANIRKIGVYED